MVLAAPEPAEVELRRPVEAESEAESEAGVVGSWSLSAEETARWCSSNEHPVSAARVISWWEPGDVEPYIGIGPDGALVAYGELWLDPVEGEVELARLIVAPSLRGRGVGRGLVAGLVEKALATGLGSVVLRLDPANVAALRCYRSSGFRELDAATNAVWNKGQPTSYTWMELVT